MTSTFIKIAAGNPRNSVTDKDSGLRFYRWEGVDYPSVTSIRRMAGVTMALSQWTVTQVVDRAVDRIDELNRMLATDDPKMAAAAKTWLRKAVTEQRDKAADLGTRVHHAAAEGLTFDKVGEDVVPFLRQYMGWLSDTGVTVLCAEEQVFNLTLGYAGSFDLLVEFPGGDRYVVDIKTGKGIYSDHALQAIGYGMAEFVGRDDVVLTQETEWLNSVSGLAILHLRPTGWSWNVIAPDHDMAEAFTGLLRFATWTHAHQSIDNLIASKSEGAA